MNTHPATVTAPDLKEADWFKSSYSGNGTTCVEVAVLPRNIAVRDSKNPDGPALPLTPPSSPALITTVRNHNR